MKANQKPAETVDHYIAEFPANVQTILQKIRVIIKKAAPGAEEAMKYGIPTFTLKGNLVHFAAYKNHIGFYPAPSGIDQFKKELATYRTGKGTLQFPLDKPIPFDVISKVVKFRVEELKNAGAKKKK